MYSYSSLMNQALFDGPDQSRVDTIANSFAQAFVGASPAGVIAGANDDAFRKVIANGIEFYKRIGIKSMNIRQCDTVTLDDYHVLANVTWQCVFDRPSGKSGEIIFNGIYIAQDLGNDPKIFAYITGDEQKALKEEGLI